MTITRGLALAAGFAAAALTLAGCTAPTAPATTSASAGASAAACPPDALCKVGAVVKPTDGRRYKIGVSFAVLDQFLQNVADGMKARAAEAGVDLTIVAAQSRSDVQLNQVQDFIAAKMDAIIVLPQTTDATGPITSAVRGAGIPLVYVNRRPSALPDGVPYVGSDEKYAGELQGGFLAKALHNTGSVVILQGDPAQEATRLRTQGCQETVEKAGLKVIDSQAGSWAREKGLSITETWLQSGKKIDAICSNNDEMALGAIQALQNAGKLAQVKVVGVDATKDGQAAVKAGTLAATVFQDAKGQGSGGIDAAVQLANGGKVAAVLDIPFELVTADNLAQFAGR